MTSTRIIDVWADNFLEEMKEISELLEEFNVIALDTEFPGVSYDSPEQDDKEYEFAQLVKNVQKFKLIQLGISLGNEDGEVPLIKNTWQFHFKFNLAHDKIMDPVKIMLEQAGINFEELNNKGIDQDEFCDYITGSGLILNDDIKYIVFHGEFDFGYLIHLVHHSGISESSEEFSKMMKLYFPQIFDLKYILRDNIKYKDIGLSKLAYKIEVHRIGPEHQAGSDALLTLQCYYQMKRSPEFNVESQLFEKNINIIYGIGKGYIPNNRRKTQNNNQTPDPQIQVNQNQQNYFDNYSYDQYENPYYYQQYQYIPLQQQQYYSQFQSVQVQEAQQQQQQQQQSDKRKY